MILTLKANPNAPKSRIKRYENDILYLDIKAPAEDGKANKEVVGFLAKIFGVAADDIKILSGGTSRTKKVKIAAVGQEDVIRITREL